MNLDLGEKLGWRILSDSIEWWKKAFTRNYFQKNHFIRPEGELWEGNGSKIWRMCKASSSFMLEHLSCKPGNRKHIHLWKDKSPLSDLASNHGFVKFSRWMEEHGYSHLANISYQDDQGLWCGWKYLDLPIHLMNHWHSNIIRLKGFVPIITSKLDNRIWQGGKSKIQTVKDGYALLIKISSSPLLQKSGGRFKIGMGFLRSTFFARKWFMSRSSQLKA